MHSISDRAIKLIILSYPLFYLGIGGKYPWVLLGKYGTNIGFLLFFVFSLSFIMLVLFGNFINKINEHKICQIFYLQLVIVFFFVGFYDLIQFKHFARFGYHQPFLLYGLDIFVLSLVVMIIKNKSILNMFILISIFLVLHQILSIYYFPLVIERSDMFMAILISVKQFIMHLNPYDKISPSVGIPPYLPLTMLSFYPAGLLKVDPRIIALGYSCITLLLILNKIKQFRLSNQILLCLIFTNPYWLMRHDLYFQLFILELVVIFCYFDVFNEFFKTILLGCFISTLQFAWILYPFILLAYSSGIKQLLRQFILSLILALIITMYYVNGYFLEFYRAVFLHKEYLDPYNSDITFGLSTIFHFAPNQIYLYIFQLIGCLIIVLVAFYSYFLMLNRNRYFYLSLAVFCYGYFMITNYFIETYLLIPVLVTYGCNRQY